METLYDVSTLDGYLGENLKFKGRVLESTVRGYIIDMLLVFDYDAFPYEPYLPVIIDFRLPPMQVSTSARLKVGKFVTFEASVVDRRLVRLCKIKEC